MHSVRQGSNSWLYTENLENGNTISWSAKKVMPNHIKFSTMGNQDKTAESKCTVICN